MAFVCYNCRTEIKDVKINELVFCPKCAGRVLFKETPKVVRTTVTD